MSKIGIPLFGPYPPDHNQCVYIRKVECRNGSVSAGRRFSMFPSAPVEACTQSGGARNWADMGGSRTSPDLSHAHWEVKVRQGEVRRGEVRQGKARSGEVRRGKARQGETR